MMCSGPESKIRVAASKPETPNSQPGLLLLPEALAFLGNLWASSCQTLHLSLFSQQLFCRRPRAARAARKQRHLLVKAGNAALSLH